MSDFSAKIHEKRHQLTTQLVAKLLGLQPEDENFSLAHDFCLQKEYYHSFGDVNPSAVEAYYAELAQRLQEDSQPSKAAALSALTCSLLGSDLAAEHTPELNHKLLQLLASLAGQPLDSTLEETPQLLQLLYQPAEQQPRQQPRQQRQQQQQQQVTAVSRFRQLLRGGRAAAADAVSEDAASTAGSSSEDEYDPYADDSDLSSWEPDDEQQQQLRRTAAAQQDADDDAAEAAGQLQPDIRSSTAPAPAVYRPAAALQAPRQLQPGRATPGRHHLLGRLAAARPAQLQALCRDRDCCFSEQYLAQQLLRVLQGQQAHAFLLQAEQQAGAALLVADSCVTTPALSQDTLQALLAEFAEAGSAARQLRRLAAQLTRSRGRPWLLSSSSSAADAAPQAAAGGGTECGIAGVPATSCLRAFGVALQLQLDLMGQQLAAMQSTGVAAAGTSSSSNSLAQQPALTLLLVKLRTRPIVRRLQLLHKTVEPVLNNLGGCPADASAALLDGLQEAASAAALKASGEQGVADAAALLHLLLCSCVPLVAALSQWLWSAADGAAPGDSQLAELPPADTAAAGSRRSSADAADAQQQQQQQQPQGVSCCCEDFFIVKHAAVAATDARFWHAAYGFSQQKTAPCNSSSEPAADNALGSAAAGSTGAVEPGGEAAVACPAFLQSLAGSIMTAGKSVRLLDYMEQEELRRTSFCSSSSKSSSNNGVLRAASGAWLGVAAARGSSKPAWQLARSSSAGGATQHLGRQPDSSRQPFGKARSSSMGGSRAAGPAATAAAAGSRGRTHRRQWSSTGAAPAPAAASQQPGLSLSNFTKQVRLQLAVAAAVAGRSEQEQLPQQFIAAASQLLQRQQPGTHLAAAAGPAGKQAAGAVSAGELMLRVLQAAGKQLSQPCAHPSEASLGQQQQQQQHAAVSLRDALLAAKAQRAALTSVSDNDSAGTPLEQQPTPAEQQQAPVKDQQAQHNAEEAQPEQHQETAQQQQPSADEACLGNDSAQAADTPAAEDTAAAEDTPAGGSSDPVAQADAAADAAAESAPDVPRLQQWRDQLEARLAVTGSCLKHMAPWQQQQQQHSKLGGAGSTCAPDAVQPAGRDASGAARGSLLLPAAGSAMPGSFSASLAGLWPLQQPLKAHRSAAAAIKQWGAAGSGSGSSADDQQQRLSWLTGGCPGDELAWLLLEPPRSLPPLLQLLDQALLAPIQERLELVGSRLLGSLMGEWGLLHQLQGLVAVSLLASPTMVEWCEACFAAAEAAEAAKRQHKARPGSPGKDRAANTGGRLAAGGGVGGGPSVVLGADELDVVELELLLQDLVSAADCPENPLPDPACLHLSINAAALAELRTMKQKQLQAGGSQAAIGDAAAAASAAAAAVGSAGAAATGGLWGCAAEWAGLSCRHSGSWQLSLLYNPAELARFSMAWRFLLQLRWVRRRLDAARHGACKGTAAKHGACKGAAARHGARKGTAARHDAAGQDAREEAAVAAAMQAAAASRGVAHSRASEPGSGSSAAPKWLNGRQELLLLQEMGQMMGRWQQYVMDRLLRAALPALLQALCSAGSLDEVRSAAAAFLATVSNLCNARPSGKGAGGTWHHIGKVLARLMDSCLAAAAAAARLQELRQTLDQPGLEPAEAQRSWLELCGLRARLAAVADTWRDDVGYLLRILNMRSTTLGDADDLEALLGCLDANGYWQRLAERRLAAGR